MIIKLFLIFGCSLILTIALGQAFISKKSSANISLIFLALACSVWSSQCVIQIFDLLKYVPHINKTQVPFLCITGPLWYLYVKCLVGHYQLSKKTLVHIIPSIICALLSIPFYLQSAEFKLLYKEVHLYDLTTICIYIASRISEVNIIIYLTTTLFFLRTLTENKMPIILKVSTIRLMVLITLVSLTATLFRLVGSVFDSDMFSMVVPSTIITLAFVMLYCLSQRNPSLVGLNFIEKKKSKRIPSNKKPKHGDILLIEQYSQTIQEQELYLNPDITIAQLAKNLQTQVHNLSELINNTTNYNFKGFINTFRIEHAKMLLLEDKSSSIIDIAYASGFNSKSVFYNHFIESTSLTPSEFRKNNTP